MLSSTLLLLTLTAASAAAAAAAAAPHNPIVQVPQGINNPPDASSSSSSSSSESLVLPGFNHLALNRTKAAVESAINSAFGGACEQVTLGGHGKVGLTTLEGRCVDGAGTWWETSIGLNECVGNTGGHLEYRDGGAFDASCRPCTLDNVHDGSNLLLKCNCLDDAKFPRYTALELGPGGKLFFIRLEFDQG